jgi:hypothetical protein
LVLEPALISKPALVGADDRLDDRLGWLTGEQVRVVSSWYTADSWRQSVGEWLDANWATGWEAFEAQDKRTWLQELIEGAGTVSQTQSNSPTSNIPASNIVHSSTATTSDRFSWMLPEQVTRIVAAYGTSWRASVGPWLEEIWGTGWEQNFTDQDKATVFTGLLDTYFGVQSEPKDVEAKETVTAPEEVKPKGELKRRASGEQSGAPKAKDPKTAQRMALRAALTSLRSQGKRDFAIQNRTHLVEYLSAMADGTDRNAVIDAYNEEISSDDAQGSITVADLGAVLAPQPAAVDWAKHWSEGDVGSGSANGRGHFAKHGNEHHFAYASVADYTAAAVDFRRQHGHNAQYEEGRGNNSIICRYSRSTARGTYLVMNASNKIISFYALADCDESYLRQKVQDLSVVYTD